jgi:hypothetical protein
MAAGLGFIEFTTGDVLSAAAANGYLASQTVMVFADAAARTSAIASPQEGMFSFLKDTNATQFYDGAAWVNLDTTGMVNPMTTTGDVIYSSSGTTPARLGIGTAGQVLRVNSGATAPEWATAATGGKVLQVVTATLTTTASTTSTTFTDTGLTASITPSSASSRILILATLNVGMTGSASSNISLFRDSTNLLIPTSPSNRTPAFMQFPGDITGSQFALLPATINWTDSPASTSALAYKLRYQVSTPGTAYINRSANDADNAAHSRGVSAITLLEIGA